MYLDAACEERLGEEDVGAAAERAVRVAGLLPIGLFLDRPRDFLLQRRGHRSPVAESLAAVMDHAWPGEPVEDLVVDAAQLADEAELATRGRDCPVVASVERRGPGEGSARARNVVEQEVRLRLGRGAVVALVMAAEHDLEHLPRKPARAVQIAADET